MSNEHIVISGWYGQGNVGDDAMLAVLLRELQLRLPDAGFTVLSEQPLAVEEVFAGQFPVTALAHPSPYGLRKVMDSSRRRATRAVWRAVKLSSAFILGGGSLVRDHNLSNFLRLMDELLLANRLHVPSAVVGVTVGPLETRFGRYVARTALRHTAIVGVRDRVSQTRLFEVGVPAEKIHSGGDLALLLPIAPGAGVKFRDSIAICPCKAMLTGLPDGPPGNPQLVDVFAAFCGTFNAEFGARILMVPLRPGVLGDDDLELALAIRRRSGVPELIDVVESASPPEIKAILGSVRMVIGARFHSLVFAASQGVPVIGISYGEKVRYLLEGLDLADFVLDPGDVTTERLLRLCRRSLSRLNNFSALAAMRLDDARSSVSAMIDTVASVARRRV